MEREERQQLVSSWLMLQRVLERKPENADLSWVVPRIWDLCDYAPFEALQFIVEVLDHDRSVDAMAILSAGPLEALLRKHGARIIQRVERRARYDRAFADLLGHVWRSSVSHRIWIRMQSARERQGREAGKRAVVGRAG